MKTVAAIALSAALSSILLSACTYQRTMLGDLHSIPSTSVAGNGKIWLVKSIRGQVSLVAVSRQRVSGIEPAVKALLDGPSNDEIASGFGSEIPRGTVLRGIEDKNGRIEIDLSRRFASGGGIDSIETRLAQLSRTVAPVAGHRPVYLNVEGRRLTMTPGEGVEVKQPINK